jgi:hypothetical protein
MIFIRRWPSSDGRAGIGFGTGVPAVSIAARFPIAGDAALQPQLVGEFRHRSPRGQRRGQLPANLFPLIITTEAGQMTSFFCRPVSVL